MSYRNHRSILRCLICPALLALPSFGFSQQTPNSAPQLWTKSPSVVKIITSPQAVADYLPIKLDRQNIEKLWDEKLKASNTRYLITLPDGSSLQAYTVRIKKLKDGWLWQGGIDGDTEKSSITLSYVNEVLVGEIVRSNGRLFRIRFAGDGVHVIEELAPNKFGPGARPIEVEKLSPRFQRKTSPKPSQKSVAPKARRLPDRNSSLEWPSDSPDILEGHLIRTSGNAVRRSIAGCVDSGNRIDLLVVYTPKAKSTAGGESAIRATIELAIDETNQSYENSGIVQRVELVGAQEIPYVEGSFVTNDLDPLRTKDDGVMDEVHDWRDQVKADIVVLLTANEHSIPCGVAYQLRTISPVFEEFAFAAVPLSCATGQFYFGHELGHAMGADEDWAQSTSDKPFPYSHGLAVPHPTDPSVDPWRTIMAENIACSSARSSTGCVRLKYWSNPDLVWKGQRMGISRGSQPADNRRALNNTAKTVANFRSACK